MALKVAASIQNPNATFANGVIHRIRSEVDAVRPLNRAQHDLGLSKDRRVPQRLENGAVDPWIDEKRAHLDFARRPIQKTHAQPRVRQSGHGRHAPGNGMSYRRFYFRGSIIFGVFSWLHRFQSSISSSRCAAAHSNTNAIARRGKEPRMTRKSRRSISASCSAYRAWKWGGA